MYVDANVMIGVAGAIIVTVIGLLVAVYLRLGRMESRMDAMASDIRDMCQEICREIGRVLDAIARHEHRDDGSVVLVLSTVAIPTPSDD